MDSAASEVGKSLNMPHYFNQYENTKFFRIQFIVNWLEKSKKDASGDTTEPSKSTFS